MLQRPVIQPTIGNVASGCLSDLCLAVRKVQYPILCVAHNVELSTCNSDALINLLLRRLQLVVSIIDICCLFRIHSIYNLKDLLELNKHSNALNIF